MARKQTHLIVGIPVGLGMAAYLARERPPEQRLVEALGGGFGGAFGAILPDLLEPATSSWHRSLAHSYTAATAGLATLPKRIVSWQEYCREQADQHDRLGVEAVDGWSRAWHSLVAFFWRFLSGFAAGVATGYASHLVLDMVTPRSLPLIC